MDEDPAAATASRLSGSESERKFLAKAAPHMAQDETPLAVYRGQTNITTTVGIVLLVITALLFLLFAPFVAKPRTIVVTDRQVYVFRPGLFKTTRLAVMPRPQRVELAKSGLKVGDQPMIYASGKQRARMEAVAELAQTAPSPKV